MKRQIFILRNENSKTYSENGFWKECVVIAESVVAAKNIHPCGKLWDEASPYERSEWSDPENIQAIFVGTAGNHMELNTVLSKAFVRLG